MDDVGITFAAFYASLPTATIDQIQNTFSSVTLLRPLDLLEAAFASARFFTPACNTVILTDETTPLPARLHAQVARFAVNPERLMESRMMAWRSYLQTAPGHVIFVDSDILIQQNLAPIFEHEFHVALTYRNEAHWPINAGVMCFHAAYRPRGIAFLEHCLDVYHGKFTHAATWGGDQDVLRELVHGVDVGREDVFTCQVQGFKILFLPCSTYNFSTEDEMMGGDYASKAILHYKGRRKHALLPAWQRIQARV